MGGDQDGLSGLEVFLDVRFPVRHETDQNVLQALRARNGVTEVGVAGVAHLGEFRAIVQDRRRGVVRAAPKHELLFAEFGESLGLVLALQGTVVTLVESPVALDRNPAAVGLVQGDVGGVDGPLQERRVQDVREHVVLNQELSPAECLLTSLVVEVNIHPAGEQVLGVPVAVAVAQQNQLVSHDFHPSRAEAADAERYIPCCAVG
ncbi:hypothetical protein SRABI83_03481 [Arthrobacter sp. Bi83]|nr:hypothetical protein SRABI83_03481 [Arthrobacter sp. Bi83]